MSKKDIIRFRYTVLRRLTGQSFILTSLLLVWIYVFRYGIIFPVVANLWFGTLTFMYNTKEPAQLILISMSVVTAVRVTAYFSEDLSRDLARILPFALLGIHCGTGTYTPGYFADANSCGAHGGQDITAA